MRCKPSEGNKSGLWVGFEQELFPRESRRKTAESSMGSFYPVAGDKERNRILSASGSDGAASLGFSYGWGEFSIGLGVTEWNSGDCLPNVLLIVRAGQFPYGRCRRFFAG